MKRLRGHSARLLIDCVVLLGLQVALLHVLARTHFMEKLMAAQFNRGELAVILLFVALRFAAYFLVPAFLAALAAWEIAGRLGKGKSP